MPRQPAVENVGRRLVMRHIARHAPRAVIVAVLAGTFAAALSGCGQRGPLFLPDKDNPDKRR